MYLIEVVKSGNIELLELSLSTIDKIDVDYIDGQGLTALHYAVINDRADMAKVLIKSGAKINAEGRIDTAAYFYADNKAATYVLIQSMREIVKDKQAYGK